MEKSMSEGESDLIQIFLFNLRLVVAMGTQRHFVDLKDEWHFYTVMYLIHQCWDTLKLKYMVPLTIFYCIHKEECLMCTLRAAQGCGLELVVCVLWKQWWGRQLPGSHSFKSFPFSEKRSKIYIDGCCQCCFLVASLPKHFIEICCWNHATAEVCR